MDSPRAHWVFMYVYITCNDVNEYTGYIKGGESKEGLSSARVFSSTKSF